MYANYHGDNIIRGALEELMMGENAFAALYDEMTTDEGASFVLKPILSPKEHYVRGVHFTEEVLARSAFTKTNSEKVTGRTLKECAEKTALAIYFLFMGAFFTYFSVNVEYDLIEQHSFQLNNIFRTLKI